MFTLENQRELDGATFQDDDGRYYRKDGKAIRYGYYTWLGGGYVCYTDGHLCECGGDE
jgi:hypothetical protein